MKRDNSDGGERR